MGQCESLGFRRTDVEGVCSLPPFFPRRGFCLGMVMGESGDSKCKMGLDRILTTNDLSCISNVRFPRFKTVGLDSRIGLILGFCEQNGRRLKRSDGHFLGIVSWARLKI